MARCRHLFELTKVECPQGCGGPEKQDRKPPRVAKPRARTFTDEQLRAALTDAPSVREAMHRLGSAHWRSVRARAKSVPDIWKLFQAAKVRGQKRGLRNIPAGFRRAP